MKIIFLDFTYKYQYHYRELCLKKWEEKHSGVSPPGCTSQESSDESVCTESTSDEECPDAINPL